MEKPQELVQISEPPEVEIPKLIIHHLRDCLRRRDIAAYYRLLRGIQSAWQTLKPELAQAIQEKSLEN